MSCHECGARYIHRRWTGLGFGYCSSSVCPRGREAKLARRAARGQAGPITTAFVVLEQPDARPGAAQSDAIARATVFVQGTSSSPSTSTLAAGQARADARPAPTASTQPQDSQQDTGHGEQNSEEPEAEPHEGALVTDQGDHASTQRGSTST